MADVIVNGHEGFDNEVDTDRAGLHDDPTYIERRGDSTYPTSPEVREYMESAEFRSEVGAVLQETLFNETGHQQNGPSTLVVGGAAPVISDIRGVDTLNYRKGEKVVRCKMAACYRLLDMLSLDKQCQSYISARISSDNNFLMLPEGLHFSEVSASQFAKIGLADLVTIDNGSTGLPFDRNEAELHSMVYQCSSDVHCIIHIGIQSAVMVSMLQCGLLPLCYEAMVLGPVTYLDYFSANQSRGEISQTINENYQVIFLRSFGALVFGSTVEEAYRIATNVITATETQYNLVSLGVENLYLPPAEVQQRLYSLDRAAGQQEHPPRGYGEMEFEALMRKLDNEGLCTGYEYKDGGGVFKGSQSRVNTPMTPPARAQSSMSDGRAMTPVSQLFTRGRKPDYAVSPNVYYKEEDAVDSSRPITTTGSIKKITRWKSSENVPLKQRSTSLKQSMNPNSVNPNKYAPQGANPRELQQKVKEIRREYFEDIITAGPQSTVLEGVTWEEAQRIKEGNLMPGSESIRVTAASRGVIQRDHQKEAVFYKNYQLSNPFDNVTNEELEKYKKEVMKKSKKQNYGKYAESEPEFLADRDFAVTPIRPTTPPAKPARLSPDGYHSEGELQASTVLQTQQQPTSQYNETQDVPKPTNISPETQYYFDPPIVKPAVVTNETVDYPKRSQSARYPSEKKPGSKLSERSALYDSSTAATLDTHGSSKENSPAPDSSLKKKKKKGLRFPSFSKKNKSQN